MENLSHKMELISLDSVKKSTEKAKDLVTMSSSKAKLIELIFELANQWYEVSLIKNFKEVIRKMIITKEKFLGGI